MSSTTPTTTHRPARRRGRAATHDPETLLDLIAAVADAAVTAGLGVVATAVSMPVFNRVKLDVDRARGIADPRRDPERTPTADAIQMRFKALAGRPVKWEELLDGALRSGRQRTMWLSALRRDEARDDLTDKLVIHALRLVAAHRGADTLTRQQYDETRDELVAQDSSRNGQPGLLEELLPTANQILAHCELRWEKALRLAGLCPRPLQRQRGGYHRPRINPIPGMPLAQVVAIYAALNGNWPSKTILYDFAANCGIRMSDPAGSMAPVREQAARLLAAEGVIPPTRTRGGGKGKRLLYRSPVNGIPGAPLRDPTARRQQLWTNPRLTQLREELRILSVCVWLAGLEAEAKRVQAEYAEWATGSEWAKASTLIRNGGFTRYKELARERNASVRNAGDDPLAEALAAAERAREEVRAIYAAGTVRQPSSVPFSEALQAVLAGPIAEAEAARQ